MKIQSIRHATSVITFKSKRILLDPVLSPAGKMSAIPDVPNMNHNPLVELPASIGEIIANLDAVMVTHTHRDHFDDTAMQILPKKIPVFCQPADSQKIQEAGFLDVRPIEDGVVWGNIKIIRTGGRHGHGLIAMKMGPVSGFVLSGSDEDSLYITGDTVWCSKVQAALKAHQPQVILAYAGGARFKEGKAITMTAADILKLSQNSPKSKIITVHMEAWNHCRLTRNELRDFLKENALEHQVMVPENGEIIMAKEN